MLVRPILVTFIGLNDTGLAGGEPRSAGGGLERPQPGSAGSLGHTRAVEPHVSPPPKAVSTTRSPGATAADRARSASASGIDAADVLPTRSRCTATRSRDTPSSAATVC